MRSRSPTAGNMVNADGASVEVDEGQEREKVPWIVNRVLSIINFVPA